MVEDADVETNRNAGQVWVRLISLNIRAKREAANPPGHTEVLIQLIMMN